jgi:molybdate transport system substrate-binding protein
MMKATALMVFAAASLAAPFNEIGKRFADEHPGVEVRFNFAGSQQLAAQLEQGAPADVFASADERWMSFASRADLVAAAPVTFARNRLVAIVPSTNPGRVRRLQDFARPGIKLVIGAATVPVGAYTRQVIENLGRAEGFDPSYARRVLANVVSQEDNVRAVVAKVQLGETDAGFVYRSDISPGVKRFVRTLAIPDSLNVTAIYPVAVTRESKHPDLARAFVEMVTSEAGQATLERHGFQRADLRP